MDIRVVIVLLLIGVVVSLFSGLVFLFKDSDKDDSKRTLYALGVRICLAGLLVATISYGIYTGQLGLNAPWHGAKNGAKSAATTETINGATPVTPAEITKKP